MTDTHNITGRRLSDVVDSFLETARIERTLTGESIPKYRRAIDYVIRDMGDMAIAEILPDTFIEIKRRLGATTGPSHVNGVVFALKRLVQYCASHLGMAVADLSIVKPLPVPRQSVSYLSTGECEQFVGAMRVQYRDGSTNMHALGFRALVEVLLGTGMRISEALALNVSSVNWRDHEVKVVGKGNKERTVYFSERATRWLKRYLEARTDRRPALFINERAGRRLTRYEAQRLCRCYARRSGVSKRITLHVLRHTFATTLLKNGCPIGHIQGMLGHERLETTCRYYLGVVNDEELKKSHERFSGW